LAVPAGEATGCACRLRQAIPIRSRSIGSGKRLFSAQKRGIWAVFRRLVPCKCFVLVGRNGFFRGNSLLFRLLRQKWGRGGVNSVMIVPADGRCGLLQRMAVMIQVCTFRRNRLQRWERNFGAGFWWIQAIIARRRVSLRFGGLLSGI
jgi:hypothetical protein